MLSRRPRRILLSACVALTPLSFAAAQKEPLKTASASGVTAVPTVEIPDSADMLNVPSIGQTDPVIAADVLTGAAARSFQIDTLHAALDAMRNCAGYTAELSKQEWLDGELSDVQRIRVKIRHEPHSIYMKWLNGDKGREVIYVDGQNDGEMLVHAGGWRARFLPVLSVDPAGSLAMRESRHPVTEAGLLELVEKWLTARESDIGGVTYRVESDTFEGTKCHKFVAEFDSPDQDAVYSRVTLWVDAARLIPVVAINQGWGEGRPLIERYEYREIDLETELTDADFDRKNRRYAFRK